MFVSSVCRSVGVLSCVDVIQSFTYLLRVVILDVTKRRGETGLEKARYQRPLANTIKNKLKKKKKKKKTGTSGFGLCVVALLSTSNGLLPATKNK